MNFKDNLFSADHRNKMIHKYGYTAAMSVTLDDLCFETTMELGSLLATRERAIEISPEEEIFE